MLGTAYKKNETANKRERERERERERGGMIPRGARVSRRMKNDGMVLTKTTRGAGQRLARAGM